MELIFYELDKVTTVALGNTTYAMHQMDIIQKYILSYLHDEDHTTLLHIKWVIPQVIFTNKLRCVDLRQDELIFFSFVNVIILDFL